MFLWVGMIGYLFQPATSPDGGFPVEPVLFIDQFRAAEGIGFNGEGRLFITAERAVWEAYPDGKARKLTDLDTNLGMGAIGERDILVCDFGPTNVFRHGPNDDGVVWRVTPEGQKTKAALGIADPNAVVMLPDRSYLVSDDGTDKIYRVDRAGKVQIWSQQVEYPNGMALSPDNKTLYVAQIFTELSPPNSPLDDRLWALPLDENFNPKGPARVAARMGEGLDGLAMDVLGRVYVADNKGGKIWRYDPQTEKVILIAEGMPRVSSLAFGEGKFDHQSLYIACTFNGGGRIWRVPVGVKGRKLYR